MKQFFKAFASVVILIICINTHLLYGQSGLKVVTGIGLPEFLHVGVQVEGSNTHLGATIGMIPGASESLWSASADLFVHFRKRSDDSKNPWYFRTGATYTKEHTRTKIFTNVLINARIGRMFSIDERVGMYIDIGIAINAYEDEERKVPIKPSDWNWNIDIEVPFIPSGCLVFYIKI